MAKYTLVIVDMQPVFEASNCKKTINSVLCLIRKAIRDKAPIIVLEYEDVYENGTSEEYCTHRSIRRAVGKYPKATYRMKSNNDGSWEVIEACKENNFPLDFVVCGVNTRFCVKDTAQGLDFNLNYCPKAPLGNPRLKTSGHSIIKVKWSACNDDCFDSQRGDEKSMKNYFMSDMSKFVEII